MRAFAVAVLVTVATLGFRAVAQDEAGNRAHRKGDYEKAAEQYREAIGRSGGTAEQRYNLGTSLLRLGDLEDSRRNLIESLETQSPELRARAFYNLGNAFSRRPAEGDVTPEDLRTAIETYRRALLLDPELDGARWNLELALLRLQELMSQSQSSPDEQQDPQEQRQGEGGGEQQRPREGGSGAEFPQTDEPSERDYGAADDPLSQELAEQILRAVEEHERGLQREKLRSQRKRVRGPDW